MLRHRDARQRVDRPGQHGDLWDVRFVLVTALKHRDYADGFAGRHPDQDCLAGIESVTLELGAGGQAPDVTRHRKRDIDHLRCPGQPPGNSAGRGAHRLQQGHRTGGVHIGPRQSGSAGRDRIVGGDRMQWRPGV